ncbi:MAG: hypothetical protein M3409_04790 [Gemmatimonadota bacterium]|nr:hypothetical protein [Gemmatimonadota bacterium]
MTIDPLAEDSPRPLPFMLAIVGDSGSGKNTVADGVRALIGPDRVTSLELDDYHLFTRTERAERGVTALHPSVHNFGMMREHLQILRQGRPVRNHSYNHADGTFGPMRTVESRDVVLARGLLGFPTEELRASYDLAVFLHPEPELLFRWKLRRDVGTRGYTEAEVLKNIAQHLLDSKEFVVPQAELADLVVRSEVPDADASDAQVQTSLILRRAAAEAVRDDFARRDLGGGLRLEEQGDELVVRLTEQLDDGEVEGWAASCFPHSYTPGTLGEYVDQNGERAHRTALIFTQVLIAGLTQKLRRTRSSADASGLSLAR